MIDAGNGGSIIFLSSIAGSRVLHPQEQCAYNASKAAVTHLAKSLSAEWATHGIRVNTIAPGYMDTALNDEALLEGHKKHWAAMTPMGRLGRPDELNGLAVFLASDGSRFVTGAHILADASTMLVISSAVLTNMLGWICRILNILATQSHQWGFAAPDLNARMITLDVWKVKGIRIVNLPDDASLCIQIISIFKARDANHQPCPTYMVHI